MKPTTRSIAREVEMLISYMLEREIAIYANPVLSDAVTVSWHSTSPAADRFLLSREQTVAQYVSWVRNGQYSTVLTDGALLQISFAIAGGNVDAHRLAYIPCPFDADPELLRDEPLADVMEYYADSKAENVRLHSMVRFDYDPAGARSGHPASHVTLNGSECRIPCIAPLRLGHFIDFVFRSFYPRVWEEHFYLRTLSWKEWGEGTVTDQERRQLHVAWARPGL